VVEARAYISTAYHRVQTGPWHRQRFLGPAGITGGPDRRAYCYYWRHHRICDPPPSNSDDTAPSGLTL